MRYESENDYYTSKENVDVERRGPGFGKVYVFKDRTSQLEAVFVVAGRGHVEPITLGYTPEAAERAVRALAETKWGAEVLGCPIRCPWPAPAAEDLKFKKRLS